jgi:hypothetical protein
MSDKNKIHEIDKAYFIIMTNADCRTDYKSLIAGKESRLFCDFANAKLELFDTTFTIIQFELDY